MVEEEEEESDMEEEGRAEEEEEKLGGSCIDTGESQTGRTRRDLNVKLKARGSGGGGFKVKLCIRGAAHRK